MALRPNHPAVVAANARPTTAPRANLRRHHHSATSGRTSGRLVGFEYAADPRSTAAATSEPSPARRRGVFSAATSLYSHRKYATKTSAKLKRSDVRNTAYTGTVDAPTNASVNSSAGMGLDLAARN